MKYIKRMRDLREDNDKTPAAEKTLRREIFYGWGSDHIDSDHVDLAHFHGVQGVFVGLRCDTGAAVGLHENRDFRQRGFQQHGVGDDAYVRAQPDQGDPSDGVCTVFLRQLCGEGGAAEGGLIQYFGCGGKGTESGNNLPAVRFPDTVGNRQLLSLGGIHVVFFVGIPGEEDTLARFSG